MLMRISEVSSATGIAVHRIQYAVKRGQVRIDRPDRRWARHWWTPEEVRAVCAWFGVIGPEPGSRPPARAEEAAGGVPAAAV